MNGPGLRFTKLLKLNSQYFRNFGPLNLDEL